MNLIDTEPRAGQTGSSDSRRTFPVLFHLQDVSRLRTVKPAAEPVPLAPPASPREEPTAALATTITSLQSAAAEMPLPPPPPVHAPDLRLSLPESTAPAATPSQHETVPPIAEHTEAESSEPGAVPAPTPEPSPPTQPASRTESQRTLAQHRRKAKTPAAEDWFAAHGKYIALLFVLALAGTIYIARVNRRTAPPADRQLQLEIEAGNTARSTRQQKLPATVVNESGGTAPAAVHSGSPARLETATASSPQAELFPPTTQVASSTAPVSVPPTAGDLFPAKPSPERVAARADGPLQIINPTLPAQDKASPPPATPPQTSPPAPAAPAFEPSYPSTGYPVSSYPTTSPPQFSYPVTSAPGANPSTAMAPPMPRQPPTWTPPNIQPPQQPPPSAGTDYRSAFALPPVPGAPPPPAWSSPPATAAPQFPNNYNSDPGTRNERFGPGIYQGLR